MTTRRSSPVVCRRMWSASSHPSSSPPSRRHDPSGCGIAAPSRSASGSLAIASSASCCCASSTTMSIAPGSSGFGNDTVGNAGSGRTCASTTNGSGSPAAWNARTAISPPTPCIGVYATPTPVAAGRSRTSRIDVDVAVDDRGVDVLDRRIVRSGELHRRGVDEGDAGGDTGVVWGHDLGAVAEVHLVAVVGGRVVRRRDHHRRRGVELGRDPRQHGCRDRPGEQAYREPGGGHHPSRVEGEHVALAAGVVADGDAPLGGPRVERRGRTRRGLGRPGGRPTGSSSTARPRRPPAGRPCRT